MVPIHKEEQVEIQQTITLKFLEMKVTVVNENQAKMALEIDNLLSKKDYQGALNLFKQAFQTQENAIWFGIAIQSAIKLKELGQYQYAGQILEIRAENSKQEHQKDSYNDVSVVYLEGITYHREVSNKNRNYLIARECITRGMAAALKANDLGLYARIARESENLTGEGFMDNILSDFKKVFRDDVLSLKKYTLTEKATRELISTLMTLQYKSNRSKLNETFILEEYKTNYFDKLPEEYKSAANQGFSEVNSSTFNNYASTFLIGEEKELAKKEQKRKQEEIEAFKYKKIINPFYNTLISAVSQKDTSYIEQISVEDTMRLRSSEDKLEKAIGEFLTKVKGWVYSSTTTEQELERIENAKKVLEKLNASTSRKEMLTILTSETKTIEVQLAQR